MKLPPQRRKGFNWNNEQKDPLTIIKKLSMLLVRNELKQIQRIVDLQKRVPNYAPGCIVVSSNAVIGETGRELIIDGKNNVYSMRDAGNDFCPNNICDHEYASATVGFNSSSFAYCVKCGHRP